MTHPQLRRLKIHRHGQFVDVPWIEFSPHQNLILGLNGAGKTSLLRLIDAVGAMNFARVLGQPLDVEFELEFPAPRSHDEIPVFASGRVRGHGGAPRVIDDETSITVEVGMTSGSDGLLYEISGGTVTAMLGLVGRRIEFPGVVPPGRAFPIAVPELPGEVIAALYKFQPTLPGLFIHEDERDFVELTEAMEYTLGRSLGMSRSSPHWYYALPLLMRLLRAESAGHVEFGRDASMVGRDPGDLRFSDILDPIGGQSLALTARVVRERDGERDCRGVEVAVHFVSGAVVVDRELTFGQRRYLAMALLLPSEANALALIDGIDNGLDARLVEAVLKLLQHRQSFLVSRHKIVVDHVNFDSPEDVRRKIHVCRRRADGTQMVDTLDEATAEEVFGKISSGNVRPSDALLVEGLASAAARPY